MKKQTKKEEIIQQEIEQPIQMPIEWEMSNETPCRYATNMIIQTEKEEFILSFFELKPPLLLGSKEQRLEQAKKIGTIKANSIVSIIVSPERLSNWVKIIDGAIKKHKENFKTGKEND